jgi:hypothetical protein
MDIVIVTVSILTLFLLGIILISLSLGFIDAAMVFAFLQGETLNATKPKIVIALIGLLLIIFCVRYVYAMLCRREKAIVFESAQGNVSITLYAIEDMLKRMLEERKGLVHIRLKVRSSKRGIAVTIRGNLTGEVNLIEFKKDVQEDVKEKLRQLLGEEKETKVDIQIGKIVIAGKKKIEERDPEVPFRNYF